MKKKIAVLGSTGSIGKSVLDVVARHPDKFEVVGLAEGHDIKTLFDQVKKFRPKVVSVRDLSSAKELKGLGVDCDVLHGIDGVSSVATTDSVELVVSAIVGSIGLKPTYEAICAGKNIALANKETLVAAGELVMNAVKKNKVSLIPIDSEHSAVFQSLVGHNRGDVRRIILTASGGPFKDWPGDRLQGVTISDALKHPRWSMGAKITVDSATLMNKGLEVIEAHWLFSMPPEKIDVVVHPESVIHSMVEYVDGAVMAQMAVPDMRSPIAYALSYPDRIESGVEFLDLTSVKKLTFEKPDTNKFRCLALARSALESGGSMPAVMNAANEIAVGAFLDEKIRFLDIPRIVESTMQRHDRRSFSKLEDVFDTDRWARDVANQIVTGLL